MARSSDECQWFEPANKNARGTRDAWVDAFPPQGISGVYAIANLWGDVLYVGESHTGRLRKTIARHFQAWSDVEPRPVYDRHQVQICWMETPDSEAQAAETDWINDLDPRDNDLVPTDDDADDVPF